MEIVNNDPEVFFFVGGFGEGLDHPECIAWGTDGYVYAGGEAGKICRIDMEAQEFEEIGNTGGFVGGPAQYGNHNVYA